jgi:hypothetical protein
MFTPPPPGCRPISEAPIEVARAIGDQLAAAGGVLNRSSNGLERTNEKLERMLERKTLSPAVLLFAGVGLVQAIRIMHEVEKTARSYGYTFVDPDGHAHD